MSLTTYIENINSNFDDLKAYADEAFSALKLQAQWSNPNTAYKNPDAIFSPNQYLPIDVVKSADSMIQEVNALAKKISGVTYKPPTAINNFQMLDHKVWQDAFAEQIQSSLSEYITSLGIPDKTYQDAIFKEDYDRKMQTLNDLLDLADAKVGARGFTYNNSQSTALKLDAQQKYQFDITQIGRDITKLVTEWARQNYQFAIDKGISFEQFNADFTYKYCTGYIEIYKNLLLASIEQFKASLSQYMEPIRAYIDAAKLPIEVSKINADINTKTAEIAEQDNRLQIEENLQAYDVNLRTALAVFQTQVQALSTIAQQSASFVQAASRSAIGIQK